MSVENYLDKCLPDLRKSLSRPANAFIEILYDERVGRPDGGDGVVSPAALLRSIRQKGTRQRDRSGVRWWDQVCVLASLFGASRVVLKRAGHAGDASGVRKSGLKWIYRA